MIRRALPLLFVIITSFASFAQGDGYKIDENNNVIFSAVVENIPATKTDILAAAEKVLRDAYKDTKYEITHSSAQDGFVIGVGQIDGFHEKSGVLNIVTINLEYKIRVDAMNNRARIQLIASDWQVAKFKDTGGKEIHRVKIVDVKPIGEDKTDKGMFEKAFQKLQDFSDRKLKSISEHLQHTESAPASDNAW